MHDYKLILDFPSDDLRYTTEGSSSNLLNGLFQYIEEKRSKLVKFDACLYLFNNIELFRKLRNLAQNGCEVNVVSIPSEGYDASNPKIIYYPDYKQTLEIEGRGKFSKRDLAGSIYKIIKNENLVNLYLFPHIYIRSNKVKPFSRGGMPYSLHQKSFLMEFEDGSKTAVLTSSNMACRDLAKYEIMIFSNRSHDIKNTALLHDELKQNSISNKKDFPENFAFYFEPRRFNKERPAYIAAPFYSNSNDMLEDFIVEQIENAKERIYVCAQHISSYSYSFDKKFKYGKDKTGFGRRKGFLQNILESGLKDIAFYSQTFCDEKPSHRFRTPSNPKLFAEFVSLLKQKGTGKYFVNENIHAKFIIVDDTAIISTFNYTPTQFLYLGKVAIEKFDHIPDIYNFKGIHSEVGQFFVVKDEQIVAELIKFLEIIKKDKKTILAINN